MEAACKNDYHLGVIRTTLTRNLPVLTGAIYDEICNAFATMIPPTDGTPKYACPRNQWTKLDTLRLDTGCRAGQHNSDCVQDDWPHVCRTTCLCVKFPLYSSEGALMPFQAAMPNS